jgi:fructose-bisphosphate aldolase class II
VHREFFRDYPEKFDLRDPGKIYIAEYAKFIAAKNDTWAAPAASGCP